MFRAPADGTEDDRVELLAAVIYFHGLVEKGLALNGQVLMGLGHFSDFGPDTYPKPSEAQLREDLDLAMASGRTFTEAGLRFGAEEGEELAMSRTIIRRRSCMTGASFTRMRYWTSTSRRAWVPCRRRRRTERIPLSELGWA